MIAAVEGELICRRLHQRREILKLEAASPGHDAIVPGEGIQLEIWGVVTTVIRSLLA